MLHRTFRLLDVCALGALVAACHPQPTAAGPRAPLDGVRFAAAVDVVGSASDTLVVRVTARNETSVARELWYGTCAPLSAQVIAPTGSTVRWDYAIWWRQSAPPTGPSCAGAEVVLTLAPGQTSSPWVLALPLRRILGDSLPSGRYRVEAVLGVNGRYVTGIAAGAVELRSPPT